MNQKKEYFVPDFEVFNFITESVLEDGSITDPTTASKKPAPELPEHGFGPMNAF